MSNCLGACFKILYQHLGRKSVDGGGGHIDRERSDGPKKNLTAKSPFVSDR